MATQLVGNRGRPEFKKLDHPTVTVVPERYEYHVNHDNENEALQHIQEQVRQQSRVVKPGEGSVKVRRSHDDSLQSSPFTEASDKTKF